MANVAKRERFAERPFSFYTQGIKRHPIRLSALMALKHALVEEKYEECREIIAIAKEFGASDWEIYYLLEDMRRNP